MILKKADIIRKVYSDYPEKEKEMLVRRISQYPEKDFLTFVKKATGMKVEIIRANTYLLKL